MENVFSYFDKSLGSFIRERRVPVTKNGRITRVINSVTYPSEKSSKYRRYVTKEQQSVIEFLEAVQSPTFNKYMKECTR